MRRGFPVVGFIICAVQPGIVQIYFLTSSLLNLAITHLIKNKRFRSWYGLAQFPELPKPSLSGPGVPTVSSPYVKAAETVGLKLAPSSRVAGKTSVSSAPISATLDTNKPSAIDRMVDSVKDSFSSFSSSLKSKGKERADAAAAEQKAKKALERAQQYELERRREVETERQRRNEQAKRVFEREKQREAEAKEQSKMMQEDDEEVEFPSKKGGSRKIH